MCEIVTSGYLIKWKVKPGKGSHFIQKSSSFQIQNSMCNFLFYNGYNAYNEETKPLSLSILFNDKKKFNPPVDITVRVSMEYKMPFFLPRQTISGEFAHIIWNSFDFKLRDSWLTFEMIIHDPGMKGIEESKKCFSCKENLETEFITLHKKCIDRQVKCTNCSGVSLLQNWLHVHKCVKKRGEDKSLQTPSYIDNCFQMEEISRDFSKMLDDNSDQDVEFIVGDQNIKAHKKVLSCRSDVFASMLQSDMTEGRTCRVNIEDMNAKPFREFLKYLYTGILPTLTVDTAMKFYEAGDKYNINSLKKQCADFLLDYLSPENVYDILIFADRHSDANIKRGGNDFLVKEKIPDSGEKWVEFCKQYPMLAVEVYRLFNKHLLPNEY